MLEFIGPALQGASILSSFFGGKSKDGQSAKLLEELKKVFEEGIATTREYSDKLFDDGNQFLDDTTQFDIDAFLGQLPQVASDIRKSFVQDGITVGSQQSKQAVEYLGTWLKYVADSTGADLATITEAGGAALQQVAASFGTDLGNVMRVADDAITVANQSGDRLDAIGNRSIEEGYADKARADETVSPLIDAARGRYLRGSPYTRAGLEGLYNESALRGVDEAYRDTGEKAAINAARTGVGFSKTYGDLARGRSTDTSKALVDARIRAITDAETIGKSRREEATGQIGKFDDVRRAREDQLLKALQTAGQLTTAGGQIRGAAYNPRTEAVTLLTRGKQAQEGAILDALLKQKGQVLAGGASSRNTGFGTQAQLSNRGFDTTAEMLSSGNKNFTDLLRSAYGDFGANTRGNRTNRTSQATAALDPRIWTQLYGSMMGALSGNAQTAQNNAPKIDPLTGALGTASQFDFEKLFGGGGSEWDRVGNLISTFR